MARMAVVASGRGVDSMIPARRVRIWPTSRAPIIGSVLNQKLKPKGYLRPLGVALCLTGDDRGALAGNGVTPTSESRKS
jgi:hypothetical protein